MCIFDENSGSALYCTPCGKLHCSSPTYTDGVAHSRQFLRFTCLCEDSSRLLLLGIQVENKTKYKIGRRNKRAVGIAVSGTRLSCAVVGALEVDRRLGVRLFSSRPATAQWRTVPFMTRLAVQGRRSLRTLEVGLRKLLARSTSFLDRYCCEPEVKSAHYVWSLAERQSGHLSGDMWLVGRAVFHAQSCRLSASII